MGVWAKKRIGLPSFLMKALPDASSLAPSGGIRTGRKYSQMHQVAASGVSPADAAAAIVSVGQWTLLEENVVVVPGVEGSTDVVHPQGRGAEVVDRTGAIPGRFRDGGFNSRHGPVDPFLLRVFEVTASQEGDRHRQEAQARADTVWDHLFPLSLTPWIQNR